MLESPHNREPPSREQREHLEEHRGSSLEEGVLRGIAHSIHPLTRIGAIRLADPAVLSRLPPRTDVRYDERVGNLLIATEGDEEVSLRQMIDSIFERFWRRHEEPCHESERRRRYADVCELLCLSGVGKLITLGDWRVNRVQEAANALGLVSFAELEDQLAAWCPPAPEQTLMHLHKGPGDGSLIYHLRTDERPGQRQWREIGFARELCHHLHSLLTQFVREDRRDDSQTQETLGILATALQGELHRRWYRTRRRGGDQIAQELEQTAPLCDLNSIFELLAHPEVGTQTEKERQEQKPAAGWLERVIQYRKHRTWTVRTSGEFMEDSEAPLTPLSRDLLLRYAGYSQEQFDEMHLEEHFIELEARLSKLRELRRRIVRAEELKQELHRELRRLQGLRETIRRADDRRERLAEWIATFQRVTGDTCEANLSFDAFCGKFMRTMKRTEERARTLDAEVPSHEVVEALLGYLREAVGDPSVTSTAATLLNDTEQWITSTQAAIREVREKRKSTPKSARNPHHPPPSRETVLTCLGEVFNASFLHGIRYAEAYQDPAYRMTEAFTTRRVRVLRPKGSMLHQWITNVSPEASVRVGGMELPLGDEVESAGWRVERRDTSLLLSPEDNPLTFTVEIGGLPDLNRVAYMHPQDIRLGRFVDLPRAFPPYCARLASATKSDSHEEATEFQEDLAGSLGLLAPGGVLLTDGLLHSYSRRVRIAQVMDAVENHCARERCDVREFHIDAVIDSETGDPLSVLILRRHPDLGFFPLNRRQRCFQSHVTFTHPNNLRHDSLIVVLNRMRRKMLDVAGGDVRIFQRLHTRLRHEAEKALCRTVAEKWRERYVDQDYLMQVIDALQKKFPVSPGAPPPVVPLDEALHSTLEGIRDLLLKLLSIPQSAETIDSADRILMHCFEERVAAKKKFRKDGEARQHMLLATRRRASKRSGDLLTEDDHRRIVEHLSRQMNEAVMRERALLRIGEDTEGRTQGRSHPSPSASKPDEVVQYALETLDPHLIYTFRRVGDPETDFNSLRECGPRDLPANAAFAGPMVLGKIEGNIRATAKKMRRLQQRTKIRQKPILVIDFADCGTGDLLRTQLQRLLGNESFQQLVRVRQLRFAEGRGWQEQLIRSDDDALRRHLEELISHGGLIISGGSYQDPDTAYGAAFEQEYGTLMFQGIEEQSLLRGYFICFSSQIWAQMIGKKCLNGEIVVRPGPLECGPTRIGVKESHHPTMGLCPGSYTAAMTHGRYVVDQRQDKQRYNATRHTFEQITSSGFTGCTDTYASFGGKVVGSQSHPELPLIDRRGRISPGVEQILKELRRFEAGLLRTYGIAVHRIQRNFELGADVLRANSGDLLLSNALAYLTSTLEV